MEALEAFLRLRQLSPEALLHALIEREGTSLPFPAAPAPVLLPALKTAPPVAPAVAAFAASASGPTPGAKPAPTKPLRPLMAPKPDFPALKAPKKPLLAPPLLKPPVASTDPDGFTVPRPSPKRARTTPQPAPAATPTTENRFDGLSVDPDPQAESAMEDEPSEPDTAAPKIRIPPIILRKKDDWVKTAKALESKGITIAKARNTAEGIVLSAADEQSFRSATKFFSETNYPFHTYQLQTEKTLKVVLRNIPQEITTEEVKNDLLTRGYPVTHVHRLSNRHTGRKHPMVRVDLTRSEQGKAIYQLTDVLRLTTQVEPARKSPVPTQCFRCQKFHHASNRCYAIPKCVKCALDHLTKDCPKKDSTTPATCANCSGPHTASYRGCPAFPKPKPQSRAATQPTSGPAPAPVVPGISYAQRTTGAPQPAPQPQTQAPQQPFDIAGLIQKLLSKDLTTILANVQAIITKVLSATSTAEILTSLLSSLPELISLFA